MDLLMVATLILLILNSGFAFLTFWVLRPDRSRAELTKISGSIFIYSESHCCL
jgi:hypothetical protein